jgi:hypothetical protein
MSWITALSATTLTTPVVATGVHWLKPRGRNPLRTLAFAAAAGVAAARFGFPLVGFDAAQLLPALTNQVLTIAAVVAVVAWLGSLVLRASRAGRGHERPVRRVSEPSPGSRYAAVPAGDHRDAGEMPVRG